MEQVRGGLSRLTFDDLSGGLGATFFDFEGRLSSLVY